MSKIAIVYWSGTGNTETMANMLDSAVKSAGGETSVFTSADVDSAVLAAADAVALGCPSMGAEVLEECEFEPMWDSIKSSLAGKKVALFGSYGWGDGEWMRNWEEDASAIGLSVVGSVICQEVPESDAEAELASLATKLV